MQFSFPDKLKGKVPILLAILAAALYGISAPVAKVLLTRLSPFVLASCLYLGAGTGMSLIKGVQGLIFGKNRQSEAPISKSEWPYVLGMILLDIAAPIFLMLGLQQATAATASLLNNFEIVVTSLLALLLFKEAVGRRMWLAIGLMTLASVLLSVQLPANLSWTPGAIWILLACISWGLENNCTRMLSLNNPFDVVILKGFGSGFGALLVTLLFDQWQFEWGFGLMAMLLGFVAYGFSIFLYIHAQRYLGAARTSAYYAAAPFIGVVTAWIFLRESPTFSFLLGLVVMIIGTYFAVTEDHSHDHEHEPLDHEHRHRHDDLHHEHDHTEDEAMALSASNEHSHGHQHGPIRHQHRHWPDLHHRHNHSAP